MRKIIVIIIMSFMLLSVPLTVEKVDSADPPIDGAAYDYSDSLGPIGHTNRTVNWSYFKQLFLAHNQWSIEYKRYSYSDWTDGSDYLTVERTWNDSGFWKFNLILDVPVSVYSARFTYACDLPVLDYVDRVGQYAYYLNYTVPGTSEVYNCFFNWSDMASIPNIIITHGIYDNMFWFRFKRDNVPSGHYEFDPTFGVVDSSKYYIQRAGQHLVFYTLGRHWAIFDTYGTVDGYYTSSTDGINWDALSEFKTGYAKTYFDGTKVCYFDGDDYRLGTPDSGGSINWDSAEQDVPNTDFNDFCIARNTSGNPFCFYHNTTSDWIEVMISTAIDGTWSTLTGTRIQIANVSAYNPTYGWELIATALNNGSVYVTWSGTNLPVFGAIWNVADRTWSTDTASGSNTKDDAVDTYQYYSISSDTDNNIYLAYLKESNGVVYRMRNATTCSWESEETVTGTLSGIMPSISIYDPDQQYVSWMESDGDLKYKVRTNGNWGSTVDLCNLENGNKERHSSARMIRSGVLGFLEQNYTDYVHSIVYTFIDGVSYNPVITNPLIYNSTNNNEKVLNTTNVHITPTSFNISVSDANGETMNITLRSNESANWQDVNVSNDNPDGTYSFTNTSWVDTWNTRYWISFNVTDGNGWTNETYTFTTGTDPQLTTPVINPSSGNESDTLYNISVTITDVDSDTQSVYCNVSYGTWYSNNSMSYVSGSNVSGALYEYVSTYSMVGTLTVTIYTWDGDIWNSSPVATFDVLGNASFQVNFPVFLEIGQYILADGSIQDGSGVVIDGIWTTTRIIDSTWSNVTGSVLKRYIVSGEYRYLFSTTTMQPGVYYVLINFSYGGNSFSTNRTLYLSDTSGPGHYATDVFFTFYNSKTGIGLDANSFKIYADDDTDLTGDRLYGNTYYNTYTGDTVYYRIDDYFDNQIYPTTGTYATVTIDDLNQGIDVPITWYDIAVKNVNTSIMLFSMNNDTSYYNATLFPGDSFHFNVLEGNYTITKIFYDLYDGSLIRTISDTIEIDDDTFYISTKPVATVYFSFYNTNEGLGLDRETLKVYINGSRLIGNVFVTQMNTTMNLTIKDYYNLTMYNDDITINNTYTFLDLGLTFHSWLFGNMNEDYYMISIRKAGGSRWWERGIIPYGEREFLIPSGTYALRIYDHDDVEIYNSTLPESVSVVNSKVYVIYGTNLSEVISGQSVIKGDLLELQTELDDATRPSIVTVGRDLPGVYSIYEMKGMTIGSTLVCPPLVYFATTTNETMITDNTTSYPLIPDSDSDNGTIYVRNDEIRFSGNSSRVHWVYVAYGSNKDNYTYLPNTIDLEGENVTIDSNVHINITRVTEYESQDTFYWTKYLDTIEYEATISIDNPFRNDEIENVYCHMGFANDTTPDFSTVTFYDVTNGVYLTEGENFLVVSSGIEWYLANITDNASRSFTAGYTGETGVITPSTETITANDYDDDTLNGDPYYTFTKVYLNEGSGTFEGTINIQFNFSTPYPIDSTSIRINDQTNDRFLDRNEFTYTGASITIMQDTVGTVQKGSTRTYQVYFNLIKNEETQTLDTTISVLKQPIIIIGGYALLVGHLITIALAGAGAIIYEPKQKKKNWPSMLLIFFAFLVFLVTHTGV